MCPEPARADRRCGRLRHELAGKRGSAPRFWTPWPLASRLHPPRRAGCPRCCMKGAGFWCPRAVPMRSQERSRRLLCDPDLRQRVVTQASRTVESFTRGAHGRRRSDGVSFVRPISLTDHDLRLHTEPQRGRHRRPASLEDSPGVRGLSRASTSCSSSMTAPAMRRPRSSSRIPACCRSPSSGSPSAAATPPPSRRLFRTALELTDRPKRDAAILMHADFTHNPKSIPDLVRRIESGADLVVAEGKLEGEPSRPHRMLRRFAPQLLRGVVDGAGRARPGLRLRHRTAGRAPERDAEPSERLPGDRRLGGERGALLAGGTLRPPGGSGAVGRAARSPAAPQPHPAGGRGAQPLASTRPAPRHAHCARRRSRRRATPSVRPRRCPRDRAAHAPGRRAPGGARRPAPSSPPDYPFTVGETLTYSAKLGMLTLGSGTLEVAGIDSVRGVETFRLRFRLQGKTVFYSLDDVLESYVATRRVRVAPVRPGLHGERQAEAPQLTRSSPTPASSGRAGKDTDLRQPRGPAGRRGLLLFRPDHAARSGQEVRVRPVLPEGEEPGHHRGGEARDGWSCPTGARCSAWCSTR